MVSHIRNKAVVDTYGGNYNIPEQTILRNCQDLMMAEGELEERSERLIAYEMLASARRYLMWGPPRHSPYVSSRDRVMKLPADDDILPYDVPPGL